MFQRIAPTLVLSLLAFSGASAQSPSWSPLFDGKSLNGWKVCDGEAKYRVEDGTIVGTTVAGSPNTFLCTAKDHGNFVLEFETKTDPLLNSGVQIRAQQYTKPTTVNTFNGKQWVERKHEAGRVYGYQVEIANESNGASGGIYDEARRGWLHNTSQDNGPCRTAFKDNQWNKYRVEANGDHIRTFVNGVPCADLIDATDLTGPIALQVHSYKGPAPVEVRWRNIRIQDRGRHQWRSVMDGKSLAGWSKRGGGNWTVEEGSFHGVSVDGDERIGFLLSDAAFRNVTARVRFRIPNGNSGFFVRVNKENMASYEYEIDAEKRTGGLWEVRGRNWVVGPEDNARVRSDGWNEAVASVHGKRLVFFLNGIKTVELPNDKGVSPEGHLALQVHGSKNPTDVWFKDIEVLEPAR